MLLGGNEVLIDFCRASNCKTRKVIDAPGIDNYMTKEKYERYIEEHQDERCITRS